jgi:hypothetical protein
MKENQKIAIVSFSPIHCDGRVLRQVAYLSERFEVAVIGYGQLPALLEGKVEMHPVRCPTSLARRGRKLLLLPLGLLFPRSGYETLYWHEGEHRTALECLLRSGADAIHANDWESLPVAVKAAREMEARILLDLHEYAPLMRENRRYWKVFYKPMINYFLRNYTPYISAGVTVGQVIAERYAREYGFRPAVVMNAPRCTDVLRFRPTDPQHVRLVHHGAAIRDRRLELMIETLAHTDSRYTLHFMLIESDKRYASRLKAMAGRLAPGRVFFHPPVKPAEIVGRISEFDVGFYLLPFASFNQEAALPNKFFDFVAAGLAVCVGPSPEMARLARQYGFGVVAPSFEPAEVAEILNDLTAEDVHRMRANAIKARDTLNADVEMGKLMALYDDLFSR